MRTERLVRAERGQPVQACSAPLSEPPRSARSHHAREGSGSAPAGYLPAHGTREPSGHRSEPVHHSSRRCSERHATAKPPGLPPHAQPQPPPRSEGAHPARDAHPEHTPAERTSRYARESPRYAPGNEHRDYDEEYTSATAQTQPPTAARTLAPPT